MIKMVKYDSREIETITIFEKITGTTVKDCIINEEEATILVKEGDIGAAIGKKGTVINDIKKRLGKELHVYEYSENLEKFIENLMYPLKPEEVTIKENTVEIRVNPAERKRAIGRQGKKIKNVNKLVKRHYDVDEVTIA